MTAATTTPERGDTTHPNIGKAIAGGFAGTIVMTLMMYFVAPMMLGKPMDVAAMLGSVLGGSWAMGLLMHFVNGTVVFPIIYGYLFYRFLPGESWLKGMSWGLVLWFVSQALVMPMMGAGLFSAKAGGLMAVMASLLGHAIYGALLGAIAGDAAAAPASSRIHAAA